MFEAFLFDFDGTLVDSAPATASHVNALLEKYGGERVDVDFCRSRSGFGIDRILIDAFPHLDPMRITALVEEYLVLSAYSPFEGIFPFKGVFEALCELKEQNFPLFVFTNKNQDLARILIDGLFPKIFEYVHGKTGQDRGKPHPEFTFSLLHRFSLDPRKTLLIGDTEVDFQSASKVHMATCIVNWGYRKRPFFFSDSPEPRFYVDSPFDLKNLASLS